MWLVGSALRLIGLHDGGSPKGRAEKGTMQQVKKLKQNREIDEPFEAALRRVT